MYHKILATISITLFATWIIGAILGSQKLEKACVVGLILLATVAALAWVLTGVPPVPHWITSTLLRVLHLI